MGTEIKGRTVPKQKNNLERNHTQKWQDLLDISSGSNIYRISKHEQKHQKSMGDDKERREPRVLLNSRGDCTEIRKCGEKSELRK